MRRVVAVAGAVVLLVAGYATLDVYDVVPGVLTLRQRAGPDAHHADAHVQFDGDGGAAARRRRRYAAGRLRPAAAGPDCRRGAGRDRRCARRPGAGRQPRRHRARRRHRRAPARPRSRRPPIPASSLKLLSAAAVDGDVPGRRDVHDEGGPGRRPRPGRPRRRRRHPAQPGRRRPQGGGRSRRPRRPRHRHGERPARQGSQPRSPSPSTCSYAPGPLLAPTWSAAFRPSGITGAVATIGLSSQRVTPGQPGPADPAAAVGAAFVAGLTATGRDGDTGGTRGRRPRGRSTLATVTSAPVVDQLALALDESDNALTESLTRQAAYLKGTQPGFDEAAAFVRQTVGGARRGPHRGHHCRRERSLPPEPRAGPGARRRHGAGDSEMVPWRPHAARAAIAGLTGTLATASTTATRIPRPAWPRQDRHADRRQRPGGYRRDGGRPAARPSRPSPTAPGRRRERPPRGPRWTGS